MQLPGFFDSIIGNALLDYKDFITAIWIYFVFIVPPEMLVHELGHFYFQRRFGIQVEFFQIGIGKIVSWQNRKGTRFILGLPILKAESRGLGELVDREEQKDNPRSFYYKNRHPLQRIITAVAGPMAAILCVLAIVVVLRIFGVMLSPVFKIIVVFALLNELINLLLPIKFPWPTKFQKIKPGIYSLQFVMSPDDSFITLENILLWIKMRKKSKTNPRT